MVIWFKFCLLDAAISPLLLSHPSLLALPVVLGSGNGSVVITRMRDGRLHVGTASLQLT
jgi:hypothetical protein